MADILIKDIRLPDYGEIMVELQAGGSVRYVDSYGVLKTVKATTISDHGRLIDADALIHKIEKWDDVVTGYIKQRNRDMVIILKDQETVIPADKDEQI